MEPSDLAQGAGLALGIVAGLGIIAKLAMFYIAMRGTKPEERAGILRELPPVLRSVRTGPSLPVARKPDIKQDDNAA